MDKLLKNILRIKDGKGITDQKFQTDLGLYASAVSEWKKGKSKSYENKTIILRRYNPGCLFCETVKNLTRYKNNNICYNCLEELKKSKI